MPTYLYRCNRDDGHAHEEFRAIKDRNNAAVCPTCQASCTRAFAGAPEIYIDPPFRYYGGRYADGTGLTPHKMIPVRDD